MERISEGFELEVLFVFDREQSYLEIRARFEKENGAVLLPEYQRMSVKFYADSLRNPKYWSCSKVDKTEGLSSGLKTQSKTKKYLERGELWLLDLEYVTENIVAEGIYDRLEFAEKSKIQAVNALRQLFKVNDVKLYLQVTNDSCAQALAHLKVKLKDELVNPPFQEYMSRARRYT